MVFLTCNSGICVVLDVGLMADSPLLHCQHIMCSCEQAAHEKGTPPQLGPGPLNIQMHNGPMGPPSRALWKVTEPSYLYC